MVDEVPQQVAYKRTEQRRGGLLVPFLELEEQPDLAACQVAQGEISVIERIPDRRVSQKAQA